MNSKHQIVQHNGQRHIAKEEVCKITRRFPDDATAGMIQHMNEDHVDAMIDYCRFGGLGVELTEHAPEMIDIGCDGFILKLGEQTIKFEFEQHYETPLETRKALVALAQRARVEAH